MTYQSSKSFNPGEERDLGLPVVKNKSTGSTFHVIGSLPGGIRVSFRLWTVYSAVGGVSLPFRVRFGDIEFPESKDIDVATQLREKYPQAYFGNGSTALSRGAHTSMEGVIRFKTPAYEIGRIQHLLDESLFAGTLRDSLIRAMPGIDLIPASRLGTFIRDYAGQELGLRIPAPPTDTDIQFSLGWGDKALFNTFKPGEYQPVSTNSLTPDLPMAFPPLPPSVPKTKKAQKPAKSKAAPTEEEAQKALQADAGL